MLDEVKNNPLVKEANKQAKIAEKKEAKKKKDEAAMQDVQSEDKMTDESQDVEKRPRRHKQRNKPY